LEVYRPPEPLWSPRLREAATTLYVSRGQSSAFGKVEKRKNVQILLLKIIFLFLRVQTRK